MGEPRVVFAEYFAHGPRLGAGHGDDHVLQGGGDIGLGLACDAMPQLVLRAAGAAVEHEEGPPVWRPLGIVDDDVTCIELVLQHVGQAT